MDSDHRAPQLGLNDRHRQFPALELDTEQAEDQPNLVAVAGDWVVVEQHCQSEAKDQGKSIVYSSKLVGIETSGGTAETLRIDNGGLLDEDSRLGAVKLDHRAEHGRAGACRGW